MPYLVYFAFYYFAFFYLVNIFSNFLDKEPCERLFDNNNSAEELVPLPKFFVLADSLIKLTQKNLSKVALV